MVRIRALYDDEPDNGYKTGDIFDASDLNGYYQFNDNNGNPRLRTKSKFELIDDVSRLPVRTITRKEVVPGGYGIVFVTKENKILIQRGSYSHDQLREAAHIINQIAEVLEDETTK